MSIRPDACYLEGDFSVSKEFLSHKRSRLDKIYVDMSMVIKKNMNLMEWNYIKEIDESNLNQFIPRFVMDTFDPSLLESSNYVSDSESESDSINLLL